MAAQPPAADNDPAAPPAPTEVHDHRWAYALIAIFLLALLFGAWGLWKTFAPGPDNAQTLLGTQQARLNELEQRAATLSRSDQITRDANRDLQGTLAERDEEISGLRADVAFYERFVGATGQRRGLSVHELHLQPQAGLAWHFIATLTQNLNRGAVNSGRLTVSIEGTRNGKLQRLAWSDLRQEPNAAGSPYSFKYFQQVEGDLVLPAGFQPLRLSVRLVPASGAAVEQSFTWTEATRRSASASDP
jgi:hypothetical protein